MKIKIDENLPLAVQRILVDQGHDCHTVYDEGIQGGTDDKLIEVCKKEKRHLITLDLDFSDIVTYPPEHYHGINVLRLAKQDTASVTARLQEILHELSKLDLVGHLAIVHNHKIRYR